MRKQRARSLAAALRALGEKLGAPFGKATREGREETEKDLERVVHASRLLQLSEFEFFRLSHARWYGREITEHELEQVFAGYMVRNDVPFWVRHLARTVASRHSEGVLDPGEFNLDRPLPRPVPRALRIACAVLLALVYTLLFLLLSGYLSFSQAA